ncbi:MAG: DUF4157 domain-containing protein, partial [Myxococcota bacterium]
MEFYFDGSGQRARKEPDEEPFLEEELDRPAPGKSSRTHGGNGGGQALGSPGKIALTARLLEHVDRNSLGRNSLGRRARTAEGRADRAEDGSAHERPSPGQDRLPDTTLARMERAYGRSFADVQIVPDSPRASGSTHALTEGRAIHFAPGRYRPGTDSGDWLIGHELAHIIQQSGQPRAGQPAAKRPFRASGPALEAEADHAASAVVAGARATVQLTSAFGAAQAFSTAEPRVTGPGPSGNDAMAAALGLLDLGPNGGSPDGAIPGQDGSPAPGSDPAAAIQSDAAVDGDGSHLLPRDDLADHTPEDRTAAEQPAEAEERRVANDQRARAFDGEAAAAQRQRSAQDRTRSGTPSGTPSGGPGSGGSGGGFGGGGISSSAPAAASINTESPAAIIDSLAQVPASQALSAVSQAQAASPAALQAQRDLATEALP